MAKLKCSKCLKTCKGEVLKIEDKFYHKSCFGCSECSIPLTETTFYTRDGILFCEKHFNRKYGTKCHKCDKYMTGEVITAEGNFYHPQCFICDSCGATIKSGTKVVNLEGQLYCEGCSFKRDKVVGTVPTKRYSTTAASQQHTNGLQQKTHPNNHGYVPSDNKIDARPIINGDQRSITPTAITPVHNTGKSISPQKFAPSSMVTSPPHGSQSNKEIVAQNQPLSPTHRGAIENSDMVKTNGENINSKLISADGTIIGPIDSLKCEACQQIIRGQLLQAGDKFFHPECGRCIICDQPFKEAEDVYLLGTDIWHSYCSFPKDNTYSFDASHSANASFFSRGSTPYSSLDRTKCEALDGSTSLHMGVASKMCYPYYPHPHQQRSTNTSRAAHRFEMDGIAPSGVNGSSDWAANGAQIYTISYLNPGNDQGYLKTTLPVRVPKSPHFHRPPGRFSYYRDKGRYMMPAKKKGMLALVENMDHDIFYSHSSMALHKKGSNPSLSIAPMGEDISIQPRPASTLNSSIGYFNTTLPPKAEVYETTSNDGTTVKRVIVTPPPPQVIAATEEAIELSHFPAGKKPEPQELEHPKIEREDWPAPPYGPAVPERKYLWSRPEDALEEEREAIAAAKAKIKKDTDYLGKIDSGLGKVFLKDLEVKSKNIPNVLPKVVDPRNSSRTPSARREPRIPTRYGSPLWASPSRYVTNNLKIRKDDTYLCKYHSYRTSPGLDLQSNFAEAAEILSKSSTLPGIKPEDMTAEEIEFLNENHRARSAELANISQPELQNDIEGPDQRFIYRGPMINEMYTMFPHTAHHRRSMPNMTESVKIYPYHLLKTTNRKLPKDVDRTFLERHLAIDEFKYLFGCTHLEFYKLPEWRRNLMKKAAKLW